MAQNAATLAQHLHPGLDGKVNSLRYGTAPQVCRATGLAMLYVRSAVVVEVVVWWEKQTKGGGGKVREPLARETPRRGI